MKKYEFTGETKLWYGRTLHRIRALIAFADVEAGELGGWLEKEENLGLSGNAWVSGDANVSGNAWVYGDARVSGNAWVSGNARVSGDANVSKTTHYLVIGAIGSRNDITTFFRTKANEIFVQCGCFEGNIEAFVEKVKVSHGENKHAKVYLLAAEMAKIQLEDVEVPNDL